MPTMKAHRNPNLIGHRGNKINGQLAFPYHPPPPARRRVCDLPAEERPLYRLQQAGSGALSTTELLALVLGTAAAPGLLADLLDAFGSLHQLARASKGWRRPVKGNC